jgi:hypothetical protein
VRCSLAASWPATSDLSRRSTKGPSSAFILSVSFRNCSSSCQHAHN